MTVWACAKHQAAAWPGCCGCSVSKANTVNVNTQHIMEGLAERAPFQFDHGAAMAVWISDPDAQYTVHVHITAVQLAPQGYHTS